MVDKIECTGCGSSGSDVVLTRTCSECGHQYCEMCDMGADVECESCLDLEEGIEDDDNQDIGGSG